MIGNSNLFHTFSPCSGNYMVWIADGSTSKGAGMGTIIVTKDLILKFVLLIPKLTYNLLSISKLTKDLRCITHFSSTHCDSQDLESGRMIGNAKECAGLYLLKGPSNSNEQALHANIVSLTVLSNLSNKENAIMLWHFRLGHPNFQYLKKLFPTLFNNINPKLLQCEVCQFSKHVRSNYPIQGYKSSHPFAMIHSNI